MANFSTYRAFGDFQRSVAERGRYVREPEAEDFLNAVLRGARERTVEIPKETILWRAQRGSTFSEHSEHPGPEALDPNRMKPRQRRATEGRINPKGMPVLYLASTKETAMAEVRPSKGADLSLAQFKVLRDCTLVDFSTDSGDRRIYFQDPGETKRDAAVWSDIDRAFSRPTERSDDGVEYVATQVISDAVRSAGYDGIAYQSGLESGHNVALFDLEAADVLNCSLWTLRRVTYEFQQVGNPYFVTEYYPTSRKATDS